LNLYTAKNDAFLNSWERGRLLTANPRVTTWTSKKTQEVTRREYKLNPDVAAILKNCIEVADSPRTMRINSGQQQAEQDSKVYTQLKEGKAPEDTIVEVVAKLKKLEISHTTAKLLGDLYKVYANEKGVTSASLDILKRQGFLDDNNKPVSDDVRDIVLSAIIPAKLIGERNQVIDPRHDAKPSPQRA
jgi:hypothetical protein